LHLDDGRELGPCRVSNDDEDALDDDGPEQVSSEDIPSVLFDLRWASRQGAIREARSFWKKVPRFPEKAVTFCVLWEDSSKGGMPP
jgi:hypothetical protein